VKRFTNHGFLKTFMFAKLCAIWSVPVMRKLYVDKVQD